MHLDLIIPTYNRSALLRDCLESVVRASRPVGLEICVVVVDNKSSDDTKSVVESFIARQEKRAGFAIRYVFAGRTGKSAALKAGTRIARSRCSLLAPGR